MDYAAIASDVADMLGEFGQTVTIKHRSITGYSPVVGAASSETTETPKAVITDISRSNRKDSDIDRYDAEAVISATVTEIKNGDALVTAAGKEYDIQEAETVAPAGIVVCYRVKLEKV